MPHQRTARCGSARTGVPIRRFGVAVARRSTSTASCPAGRKPQADCALRTSPAERLRAGWAFQESTSLSGSWERSLSVRASPSASPQTGGKLSASGCTLSNDMGKHRTRYRRTEADPRVRRWRERDRQTGVAHACWPRVLPQPHNDHPARTNPHPRRRSGWSGLSKRPMDVRRDSRIGPAMLGIVNRAAS